MFLLVLWLYTYSCFSNIHLDKYFSFYSIFEFVYYWKLRQIINEPIIQFDYWNWRDITSWRLCYASSSLSYIFRPTLSRKYNMLSNFLPELYASLLYSSYVLKFLVSSLSKERHWLQVILRSIVWKTILGPMPGRNLHHSGSKVDFGQAFSTLELLRSQALETTSIFQKMKSV